MSPQQTLVSSAFEVMEAFGCHPDVILVMLKDGGSDHAIRFRWCREDCDGETPSGTMEETREEWLVNRPHEVPEHWKWFSSMETRIIEFLREVTKKEDRPDRWVPSDEIAKALNEAPSGEIRTVLRNLADRGIIASGPGRGFRLQLDPPG